jgi:hypothetical protein
MGPGSGRGAGFCAGYSVPGYLNPAAGPGAGGFGLGFGRGRGPGHRNMYWATGLTGWQRAGMSVPAEQELGALQGQLKAMEQGISQIQERIRELGTEQAEEKK